MKKFTSYFKADRYYQLEDKVRRLLEKSVRERESE